MGTNAANILVIRHERCTSLGLLEAAAHDRSSCITYLDVSQGDTLAAPVDRYSHIVVLGGAVSTYEDAIYPFLRYEFGLIEEAIGRGIPILGICLGAQVLARVLGARVYRGAAGREVGWCELERTAIAEHDPLMQSFPSRFRVFQSHQDTFDIPSGSVHLATSNKYPHQAFQYQNQVWALQFHLEFSDRVLKNCSAVIEQELKDSQIDDIDVPQLLAAAEHYSPAVAPIAHAFMTQFLQLKSLSPA